MPENFEEVLETRVVERKDAEFDKKEKKLKKAATDQKTAADEREAALKKAADDQKTAAEKREENLKQAAANQKTESDRQLEDQAADFQKRFTERESELQAAITALQNQLQSASQEGEEIKATLVEQLSSLTQDVERMRNTEILQPMLRSFSSLAKQIPDLRAELERDKREKVLDFYKNLLRNHVVPSISKLSIADLEKKMIEAITDFKKYVHEIKNLFIGSKLGSPNSLSDFDSKKFLSHLDGILQSPVDLNFACERLRARGGGMVIFEKQFFGFGVILGGFHHSATQTVNTWCGKVTSIEEYKSTLSKLSRFMEGISTYANLDLLIKAVGQPNAAEEIRRVITSHSQNFIIVYKQLYPNRIHLNPTTKDIIKFEVDRYEGMTSEFSGELIENISTSVANMKQYFDSGNFPLAWKAFEDAVKLIKSNPHLAKLVDIEKFEAEWGNYISAFHKRFSADGFGDQLPATQKQGK
ncbi:MAG: hypothetical protein WC304_03160 [Candidatus Gracilibacteria bacterium]